MKRTAIGVAVFLYAASAAYACSCGELTLPKEVAQTDAIFTGRVTKLEVVKVTDGVSTIEATVIPDRVFKGDVPKTVVFTTSDGCCYCAPSFAIAAKYVFFAYVSKGELVTSTCTRTKLLSEAKEELEYLKQGGFAAASPK
jgi:hypothetical protein